MLTALRKLSLKQKTYVSEYLKNGGNGQQAALVAYDVKSPLSASVISSENLNKVNIQEEIERLLRKNNNTLEQNLEKLASLSEHPIETRVGADQVLKATLELIRLRGADPGHKSQHTSLSLKAELSTKSFQELLDLHKQNSKELAELMSD